MTTNSTTTQREKSIPAKKTKTTIDSIPTQKIVDHFKNPDLAPDPPYEHAPQFNPIANQNPSDPDSPVDESKSLPEQIQDLKRAKETKGKKEGRREPLQFEDLFVDDINVDPGSTKVILINNDIHFRVQQFSLYMSRKTGKKVTMQGIIHNILSKVLDKHGDEVEKRYMK